MTLADEDTDLILTDDADRAFQGNVAMQVSQPGGQLWNQCKCKLKKKRSWSKVIFIEKVEKNWRQKVKKIFKKKLEQNWGKLRKRLRKSKKKKVKKSLKKKK